MREAGQGVLGWRTVPTDNRGLGASAVRSQPLIRQVFVGRAAEVPDEATFERRLYVARRVAERLVAASDLDPEHKEDFYVCSLSWKTLVYKGMLTSPQLESFFPDLRTRRSSRRWRSSTRVFPPTPSPAGRAPIPTGPSPTTARSTPCGATSTG